MQGPVEACHVIYSADAWFLNIFTRCYWFIHSFGTHLLKCPIGARHVGNMKRNEAGHILEEHVGWFS